MNDLKISKDGNAARGRWWESEAADACTVSVSAHCHINPGQAGFCFIRVNQGGRLYSLGYGARGTAKWIP